MSDSIIIRKLESADFAILRQLRLEALLTESSSFDSTYADAILLSDDDWRSWVSNESVFAAFDGETAVGLMGFERRLSRKCNHRATLGLVYIVPSYRGQGIADRMLICLQDFARAAGVTQFELDLSSENVSALGLYRRHGFHEFGRTPNAVVDDGRTVEDILIYKILKP